MTTQLKANELPRRKRTGYQRSQPHKNFSPQSGGVCIPKGIKHWIETPSPVHPVVYGDRRECYPACLLVATRNKYLTRLHELDADVLHRIVEAVREMDERLDVIDAALGCGLDMETVNNLLEEKAEIMIEIERE